MKEITKAQIKMIHILKNTLALDNVSYRAGLYIVYGVRSCEDLNFDQASSLIMQMKKMAGENNLKHEMTQKLSNREGMATVKQLDYILGLWKKISQYHDQADRDRALRAFVERIAKVSDLRFLTKRGAAKVINALKSMLKRKTKTEMRIEAGKLASVHPETPDF